MTEIVFYHSGSPLAHLIVWATGAERIVTPVAHCGIRYRIDDKDRVTHAGGFSVHEMDDPCSDVLVFEVPWVSDHWARAWGRVHWGKRYGWADLFTYPFKTWFRRWNFRGYLCTELVAKFFCDAAQDHEVPGEWIDFVRSIQELPNHSTITPKELAWSMLVNFNSKDKQ